MSVVLRIPGMRRRDSPVQHPPRPGVGMPEVVLGRAERLAVLPRGRAEARPCPSRPRTSSRRRGRPDRSRSTPDRASTPGGRPRSSCRCCGIPWALRRTRRSSARPTRPAPCPRTAHARGYGSPLGERRPRGPPTERAPPTGQGAQGTIAGAYAAPREEPAGASIRRSARVNWADGSVVGARRPGT